jgi:hypothetical protein
MNILVYTSSIKDNLVNLECSDGRTLQSNDWQELSGFLLMPCDYALTWHVDRLFNDISSVLSKKQVESITNKKTGVIFENRKIYYQIGRQLGINQIDIYGLKHYADNEPNTIQGLLKLAYDVMDAYKEFYIIPRTLSSPVAAFEDILDNIPFPRACDLPDGAYNLLCATDKKRWEEWRDVFKIGHWNKDEIRDYDLRSAYLSLMARLPDITHAKFFESDTMPEDGTYSWGELEGQLEVTADVTPFNFIGVKDDSITTEHLWLLNRHELGTFKLSHGYFFKLPERYSLPFKDIMTTLHEKKHNNNLIVQKIGKSIGVGIGGKLSQKYDEGGLGRQYNSIYSRIITSRCQIKVADYIHRNGISKDVISILVDGFLMEYHGIDLPIGNGEMGSWRVNEPSPFLVASLLYQWGAEKHPDGNIYDKVLEGIKKNPRSPIIGDGVDLNLLSHNRNFKDLPRTGKELLDNKYISSPNIV